MAGNNASSSLTNRDFGSTKGASPGSNTKLLSSNAKDSPDCLTPTDDLKPWEGKSGKPSGPFGSQGKEA